jgi:hypothetical protein
VVLNNVCLAIELLGWEILSRNFLNEGKVHIAYGYCNQDPKKKGTYAGKAECKNVLSEFHCTLN